MRRSALAALVPLLLASCTAPQAPTPAPRPASATVAPPVPPPAAIATPPAAVATGDWRYERTTRGSTARFVDASGGTMMTLDCIAAERAVLLRAARVSAVAAGPTTLTLRASTTLKTYAATGEGAFATARLAATDPVLDAAAFSRGSFAVAIEGTERRVPAWPEVARVIEDCRA